MISFDIDSRRFGLRAAAICLAGDRVLLRSAEGEDSWALPGGFVAVGEAAADAVVRAMREELGLKVWNPRQALVVEYLHGDGGRPEHEVELHFVVAFDDANPILRDPGPHAGRGDVPHPRFAWFDRRHLRDIEVRPACLLDALARLPADAPVVDLADLEAALEWSSSGPYDAQAFVNVENGRTVLASEDMVPEGELVDSEGDAVDPDDLEDDARWVPLPAKREFDLGNALVFDFMRERLPDHEDVVHDYFHRKGAWGRFKDLLDRLGRLDDWYAYQDAATTRALTLWAAEHGLRARREPPPPAPPPPSKKRRGPRE